MLDNPSIEEKIQILYDRYNDRASVADAALDIEATRRKALLTGASVSGGIFVANEIARLTMRTRKFASIHL
jgi:hypothetical protein